MSRVEDECLGLPGRVGKSLVVRKGKVQRWWSEGVGLVGAHQGTQCWQPPKGSNEAGGPLRRTSQMNKGKGREDIEGQVVNASLLGT